MSKKVFRQLARKNVKKSAKDYFIYFFTLTFAVCLFYMFNSIGAQFEAFQIHTSLFNRPAFEQMMDDMSNGDIAVIITKDYCCLLYTSRCV